MGGYAVALGLADGVLEEARVDPRVAHDQRIAVEEALLRHRGFDDILGGVSDVEEVDAGLHTDLVEHAYEGLHRRVARTRAEPAARAVDLLGPRADCFDAVGDAEAEVLVAVKADLCVVAEFGDERGNAVTHTLE